MSRNDFPTDDDVNDLIAQGFDRTALVGAHGGSSGDGVRVKCSQCEAVFINGVPCHETGCPNQTHECEGCHATVARKGAYCEDCQ